MLVGWDISGPEEKGMARKHSNLQVVTSTLPNNYSSNG
jgi:hypothetical protein